MRRRVGGRVASGARTRRARLGTCVCACVCTQQCMRAYAYVCAHAQNAFQRARGRVRAHARATAAARAARGDLHLGITVHMSIIICTRARMYTCMRALVACIPACVGVGVGVAADVRGGSGRPLIACHFVHFTSMYIYI